MDAQQWILQGRAAWDAIPVQDFGEEGGKPEFESVLIETGAFRTIAVAMASGAKQGSAQLQLLADQRYKRFPNFRHVLMQWARVIPKATQAGVQRIRVEDDRGKSDRPKAKSKKTTGHETFQNVNVQKRAIQRQLQLGNLALTEKYVDELVQGQVTSGRPDLAAKSLCDLAKDAKDLGYADYQLTWSAKARELSPGDPFVHNQFADALLGNGDLPKALAVYESTASDFPQNVVARTGMAEALKALGRLPEALSAYEYTVRDFPKDAVARNGKAEVLKALGRLPEALSVYEYTVRDFPKDAVARNGKAEVLKALGRLPEALSVYESTVRDFPQNVVAISGKAEVLKALGRLQEALAAYESTVHYFPQDVDARTGKAEVLKALGRLPEALAAYESTVRDFPQNAVARNGKAEVLKALGRLPEALAAYESTVCDFPQNVVARNGQASVFVRMGRYQEAEALVATQQTQTRDEWIALHILATIKLKLGKHGEAEKLFAKGAGCLWADVKSRFIAAQAVLLMDRKQLSEADALIRSERSLESKVVQIDIYRRMNRISDARKVLLELSDCKVANIIEISRDLERNMGPGPKTISNEKFVEREIEMLMAA